MPSRTQSQCDVTLKAFSWFVNTFDPIQLSPESVMHEKEVPMLCEDAPSQIPTTNVCPVTNVLGRIPLIPCYMDGQKHLTIPYRFRKQKLGGAIADSSPDNGTGSRLYELNIWLWNFSRSLPRRYRDRQDSTKENGREQIQRCWNKVETSWGEGGAILIECFLVQYAKSHTIL